MIMPNHLQVFMLLFLMLGPFKLLVPFIKITKEANPVLARRIAVRAITYSIISLSIAGFLGETMLRNFGIPVPILALSGGIILFLYALINIIHQFELQTSPTETAPSPTLEAALYPLAFPTIVTPYGIGAVIVLIAVSPDVKSKLTVGAVVVGIMVLNLIVMIFARHIFKPLALMLAILGAILGIIQVALGAKIIFNSLTELLK